MQNVLRIDVIGKNDKEHIDFKFKNGWFKDALKVEFDPDTEEQFGPYLSELDKHGNEVAQWPITRDVLAGGYIVKGVRTHGDKQKTIINRLQQFSKKNNI